MPISGRSQRGFTLIEVLVAITILLVGVLGVVAMVDGANAVSAKTKAREGANSVARSIVEVGRAVPYRSLTDTELLAALDSRPGLADAFPTSGHTISTRGFNYDVTLQVCSMDDPKDNLGSNDGTIEFCPESDHATGSDAKDRNPDDYKRVAVTLTWKRPNGTTEKTKQTSLISNPVGGLGPSVIRLEAPALTGTPLSVTNSATSAIVFNADTSTDADQMNWSVKGAPQGQATQVGTSERNWTFTWNINSPDYFVDCTYVVQAEAFDDKGRVGTPKAVTVVLNRAVPNQPTSFLGGFNGTSTNVDLRWAHNTECDILGYRVYRSDVSNTGPWTQIWCIGQPLANTVHEENTCVDSNAPATSPLWYQVRAVDTAPGGGAREGTPSASVEVTTGNTVPSTPQNVSACLGGTSGCTEPDGTAASDGVTVIRWDASTDPDAGDSVVFYRIYRDGSGYQARVGTFFPGSGANAWTDPDSPNGTHTYRVTAVDNNFGESNLSLPVTFP
jgi:prepilin-type N-terminal cleavage/methylation domain-containing protein